MHTIVEFAKQCNWIVKMSHAHRFQFFHIYSQSFGITRKGRLNEILKKSYHHWTHLNNSAAAYLKFGHEKYYFHPMIANVREAHQNGMMWRAMRNSQQNPHFPMHVHWSIPMPTCPDTKQSTKTSQSNLIKADRFDDRQTLSHTHHSIFSSPSTTSLISLAK